MADRQHMEGGWSWQKLYITSNPNLLTDDFTNPRSWYSSAAQKNILNAVNHNQAADNNNNNSHSHFPREGPSKGITASKLPRINTQERINGSKSADNKTSIKLIEHDKAFLTRGPSFDEATSRLHKAAVCSLYETVFPPPLGKSISWPRGSRAEAKRRVFRFSKRSADSDQESRISLPPLNPDTGHPFLPHIPPHQPWVSSGQNKIKSKVSSDTEQRQNARKRLQLSAEKGKDKSYRNKTGKWFKEIKVPDVSDESDPCPQNGQFHNKTPCPPVDGLPSHQPAAFHPSWRSHYGIRRLKHTPNIPVPDLKDPVQFSPVFNELRIYRKDKPQEKTEINRDEYKLKSKSSLRLKMVDTIKNGSEDKDDESLAKGQLGLSKQIGTGATQTRLQSEPGIERKSKLHMPKAKKLNTTKADRHTGMKFLLARTSEDSDIDDFVSDDENLLGERNEIYNNNNEMVNSTVSIDDGLLETKASIVNIVLSTERPPERKPRHIALSLKKMEEQEHRSSDIVQNCSQVSRDSWGDQAEILEATVTNLVGSDPKKITPTIRPVENDVSDLGEEKFSLQQTRWNISKVKTTGDQDCEGISGHLDSKPVHNCGQRECAKEINSNPGKDHGEQGTSQEKGNNENNKESDETSTAVQGTRAFTFAYKADKSALSKYNILQPFRDQSQPNIVLPSCGQQVAKPACNEWTHPPTYKLDLRNYDNSTVEDEKAST
ncbi:uncharacterized protein LOC135482134 isoform X2 [Liolophura sinensis]